MSSRAHLLLKMSTEACNELQFLPHSVTNMTRVGIKPSFKQARKRRNSMKKTRILYPSVTIFLSLTFLLPASFAQEEERGGLIREAIQQWNYHATHRQSVGVRRDTSEERINKQKLRDEVVALLKEEIATNHEPLTIEFDFDDATVKPTFLFAPKRKKKFADRIDSVIPWYGPKKQPHEYIIDYDVALTDTMGFEWLVKLRVVAKYDSDKGGVSVHLVGKEDLAHNVQDEIEYLIHFET